MKTFTDFAKLKKFFLGCLIGSIIAAALVAVVTVLFGEFNEIAMRVFMTLGLVVLHALVALAFIWDDSQRNTFYSLAFFMNVVFLLIIFSFVVSIFGVWDIVSEGFLFDAYRSFFYVGFAGLHADLLSKAVGKKNYLDMIVRGNYVLIALVLAMILGHVHADTIGFAPASMYYRILAALGIIDGTLSLLAIIFFKVYMHQHPEEMAKLTANAPARSSVRGVGVWVWLLGAFLFYQAFNLFFGVFGRWWF
jgi:hypothetical protein